MPEHPWYWRFTGAGRAGQDQKIVDHPVQAVLLWGPVMGVAYFLGGLVFAEPFAAAVGGVTAGTVGIVLVVWRRWLFLKRQQDR